VAVTPGVTCAVAPEWYLGVMREQLVPIVTRACKGTGYTYLGSVSADRWAEGNLREVFFRFQPNTPDDLSGVTFLVKPSRNQNYLEVQLLSGGSALGAMPLRVLEREVRAFLVGQQVSTASPASVLRRDIEAAAGALFHLLQYLEDTAADDIDLRRVLRQVEAERDQLEDIAKALRNELGKKGGPNGLVARALAKAGSIATSSLLTFGMMGVSATADGWTIKERLSGKPGGAAVVDQAVSTCEQVVITVSQITVIENAAAQPTGNQVTGKASGDWGGMTIGATGTLLPPAVSIEPETAQGTGTAHDATVQTEDGTGTATDGQSEPGPEKGPSQSAPR